MLAASLTLDSAGASILHPSLYFQLSTVACRLSPKKVLKNPSAGHSEERSDEESLFSSDFSAQRDSSLCSE